MSKFALLQGTLVIATTTLKSPGYIPCSDEVECGWEHVNETFQKSQFLLESESITAVLTAKKTAVVNAVSSLRSWEADAINAFNIWDGQTTAQRFATLKVLLQRFGILSSRLADFIETHKL